jgi:hypothetical protein
MVDIGQTETSARLNGTSALPPIADINRHHQHVRKVPIRDSFIAIIGCLFDHLISAHKHRRGDN